MGTFLMETLSDKLVPLETEGKKAKLMKYTVFVDYFTLLHIKKFLKNQPSLYRITLLHKQLYQLHLITKNIS